MQSILSSFIFLGLVCLPSYAAQTAFNGKTILIQTTYVATVCSNKTNKCKNHPKKSNKFVWYISKDGKTIFNYTHGTGGDSYANGKRLKDGTLAKVRGNKFHFKTQTKSGTGGSIVTWKNKSECSYNRYIKPKKTRVKITFSRRICKIFEGNTNAN